ELKARIDALERELTEASRLGRTGEVRRLLAKGMALLSGREWDRTIEFSGSLILRAEEVYVDSSRPWTVRLEQIYQPRVELGSPLSARASIHKPAGTGRGQQPGDKVADLASLESVGRDFLDEPLRIEADLSAVENGGYVLRVELMEEGKPLGSASLPIELYRGLHERLRAIQAELDGIRGFENRRADVLYPLDYVRRVNRGLIERGSFALAPELARAEGILGALQSGRDPFDGRRGDLERHYLFQEAGEIMPYRVYVPETYTGRDPFPLLVILHGLGATEDSFFDSYGPRFKQLAETHGYIVAAPLGYRVDGGYGYSLFASGDPAQRHKAELSEKDVMNVVDLMRRDYRIDEARIYLGGHSMGAIGTWHLGAKYPDVWAALACFAGTGAPAVPEKIRHIPQFVVHGDGDRTVSVDGSRRMVAEMKRLGIEHRYVEVPGGDHLNVVPTQFPAMFEFLDRHRRQTSP
ncbi:MAG: PHB depolymerase family esterase, partial [Acidobacteriota bacterium]